MAMQTTVTITVRGNHKLNSKLKKLTADMRGPITLKAVKKGAQVVKESIQDMILEQDLFESGLLYKAVLIAPGRGKLRTFLYEVSMEVTGNYDWVHEYGATLTPAKARMLAFEIEGELIFAKAVTIPARPYFRPGVAESRAEARRVMSEEFVRLVLATKLEK